MLKDKKMLITLFITAISAFIAYGLVHHLSISLTNSVGYHLFYISKKPTPASIKRWNYVLFTIPETKVKEVQKEMKHFKTRILVKQAACMPGDRLSVRDRKFYCNGMYLCTAKVKALNGESLEFFHFNGYIPKGYFFAFGQNKNSFDSRYYGLVSLNSIIAKAYPIL